MNPIQSPTNPHAAGKAAHTPGPWHVEDAPDSGLIFIRSHPAEVSLANIRKGQGHPNEANAAFIVRACNSHAALVEALRLTTQHAAELEESGYACPDLLAMARAALQSANLEAAQ